MNFTGLDLLHEACYLSSPGNEIPIHRQPWTDEEYHRLNRSLVRLHETGITDWQVSHVAKVIWERGYLPGRSLGSISKKLTQGNAKVLLGICSQANPWAQKRPVNQSLEVKSDRERYNHVVLTSFACDDLWNRFLDESLFGKQGGIDPNFRRQLLTKRGRLKEERIKDASDTKKMRHR